VYVLAYMSIEMLETLTIYVVSGSEKVCNAVLYFIYYLADILVFVRTKG
jgi:hypothetical protein